MHRVGPSSRASGAAGRRFRVDRGRRSGLAEVDAEVDVAPDSTRPPDPARLPRGVPFFAVIAVAVLVLLVGGAGGAYQGKLSEVQKNDNSSYLPASAESTRAAGEAAAFNPAQVIPGFCADGAAAWAGGCGRRCGSSGGSAPCRAHLPDRWNRDGRVSGSARVRDVGARRHLGGLVRRFAPGPVAASAVDHRGGPLRRIGSSGRGDPARDGETPRPATRSDDVDRAVLGRAGPSTNEQRARSDPALEAPDAGGGVP